MDLLTRLTSIISGGLVPEEAAKEVALYIITEGLLD